MKLLILDVDGTLTDGTICIGEHGELFKQFYCRDGLILIALPRIGITPVIITARQSHILSRRAEELGISEIHQNVKEKEKLISQLCEKYQVALDEIAYIGDDLNDYKFMSQCGLKMCPGDAVEKIKDICDYMSPLPGGHGAVRDCVEFMLRKQGKLNLFYKLYGC